MTGITTAAAAGDAGNSGVQELRRLVRLRLEGVPYAVRETLGFLGELLADGAAGPESPQQFVGRALRVGPDEVVSQSQEISASLAASVGAVMAELISTHAPLLGPGELDERQLWSHVDLDGELVSVPRSLAVYLPAGTLAGVDLVLRIRDAMYANDLRLVQVVVRAAEQAMAARVLADVLMAARGAKNLYSGRVLGPVRDKGSFSYMILPTPVADRSELILDDAVWRELDANIAALTSHRDLMRRLGLGTRRGVLLCGPPGTGKTAIARLVAAELAGPFTVILVDARSGASLLPRVYRDTGDLGPTVVILEDIDLYLGDRNRNEKGSALADFLAVMDGTEQYEDVLTIATTNDPSVLDRAVVRSARFDSVIELGCPDRTTAVAILHRYLAGLDDPAAVDPAAVVDALPPEVTGADLREVVRRTVLSHGPRPDTVDMLDTIAAGRWRASPLAGHYL